MSRQAKEHFIDIFYINDNDFDGGGGGQDYVDLLLFLSKSGVWKSIWGFKFGF